MAAKVRYWRHFIVCCLNDFCSLYIFYSSAAQCLERDVLDYSTFCFCKCGGKKLYSRKWNTPIVLLSVGKSDGNFDVEDNLQHMFIAVNQRFNVCFV